MSDAVPALSANIFDVIGNILSETRFATKTPLDVRESAANNTPLSYTIAIIVVYRNVNGMNS